MDTAKKAVLLLLLTLLVGCSSTYVRRQVELPQHIKKIKILGFKDNTNQSKLTTDRFTYLVKNKFILDRRVAITSEEQADAILFGEITRYIIDPIEYDENFVAKRYRLWMWVDISLVDYKTKELLWTEKRMEAKVEFGTIDGDPFAPSTETEAQDKAFEILAESIVKRTIDGWFEASGVSDRR